MKNLGILTALLLICGVARATVVDDKVELGVQDSRGAYQEVTFKTFDLTLGYFTKYDQMGLILSKSDQLKYNIFSDSKFSFWGRRVQIYFQDGELRSLNKESKQYKPLDDRKAYCSVFATVSFDNKEQIPSGIYKLDGTVTLVTGESHYGPVGMGNVTDPNFSMGKMMMYQYSGAYNYDHGTPFNEFGNGKNDQGRIDYVGCESFNPADTLSVGLLRRQAGSLVEVVYP